jgi:hypothetical protein
MRNSRLGQNIAVAACATALALALAACGGDDETSTSADETTATTAEVASAPDLDRYCELLTELDAASAEIYNALGADGSVPTDEELAAAQQQVFDENADLIDELATVTPTEIADDFELSLNSARERAGDATIVEPSKEEAEAGVRLQDFARENCPKPPDSAQQQ